MISSWVPLALPVSSRLIPVHQSKSEDTGRASGTRIPQKRLRKGMISPIAQDSGPQMAKQQPQALWIACFSNLNPPIMTPQTR